MTTEEDSAAAPGTIVLGHFRVLRELGRGGMGVVHEAWDENLHRRVALKVLPDEVARDPKRRERFLREARAAAAVSHASIAAVFQIDEWSGHLAIVMELAEGETLRQLLGKGPLPVAEARRIAGEVAAALGAAHRAGIAHRDLKPENVMVGEQSVKLLDFGIAKALGATHDGASGVDLTRTGQVVGTAGYMAPEQADGAEVDQRADIFSFGVLLFEMLAGSLPFDGPTPIARVVAVARDPPRDLTKLRPDAPVELVALVLRCLEKAPAARFANGAELAAALAGGKLDSGSVSVVPRGVPREGTTDPHAVTAAAPAIPKPRAHDPAAEEPPSDDEADPRAGRRKLTLAIVAIGVVAVLFLIWMVRSEPPPPKRASTRTSIVATASQSAVVTSPSTSPSAPHVAPPSMDAITALPCTFKEVPPTPARTCTGSAVSWCDPAWTQVACCAPGLVPIGSDGGCGCPPGGSRADRPPTPGCPRGVLAADFEIGATDAALAQAITPLMACYERDRTANPELGGRIRVGLYIAPNGKVFSAKIVESSFPAGSAQTCAVDVLRALAFPQPSGAAGAHVIAPIEFDPGG